MKVELSKKESLMLQRIIYSYLNNLSDDGTDDHKKIVGTIYNKIKFQLSNKQFNMEREQRIKELNEQIATKRSEMSNLQQELKKEMVADFFERFNLKEDQHFMYGDKECVGVFATDKDLFLRTNQVSKNGGKRAIPTIIYDYNIIKAI